MRVAVQLVAPTTPLHSSPDRAAQHDDAVTNLSRALNVSLEPMHPDSTDDTLRTWFSVDVPDESTAQSVVTQLLRQPDVVAAYVKPPDALP